MTTPDDLAAALALVERASRNTIAVTTVSTGPSDPLGDFRSIVALSRAGLELRRAARQGLSNGADNQAGVGPAVALLAVGAAIIAFDADIARIVAGGKGDGDGTSR